MISPDNVHLFLFTTPQTAHDASTSKVCYIFLPVCGSCLSHTASPLPLCIPCCICFVTWEYITYSHFCGKRILWILARQGAVWLDQILPCSRFFIQARVFISDSLYASSFFFKERSRKRICSLWMWVEKVSVSVCKSMSVCMFLLEGANRDPRNLSSD